MEQWQSCAAVAEKKQWWVQRKFWGYMAHVETAFAWFEKSGGLMFRFHKLLHEKINLVFRGKTRRGTVRRHLECFSSGFFLPPVSGGRSSAVALGQLREVTLQRPSVLPAVPCPCQHHWGLFPRLPCAAARGNAPSCVGRWCGAKGKRSIGITRIMPKYVQADQCGEDLQHWGREGQVCNIISLSSLSLIMKLFIT